MTVSNICIISSSLPFWGQYYTGGRLEFKMRSASVMPGVVTAVYFASGDGRTDDQTLGTQDELDFEFKGNTPYQVCTNSPTHSLNG